MESSYSVSVFAELEGSNTDSATGPVFKTSPPPPELLIDEITSTSMKLSRHEFIIKLYISSIKDTLTLRGRSENGILKTSSADALAVVHLFGLKIVTFLVFHRFTLKKAQKYNYLIFWKMVFENLIKKIIISRLKNSGFIKVHKAFMINCKCSSNWIAFILWR